MLWLLRCKSASALARVKFLSLIMNSGLVAIRMLSDYSYLVNFESHYHKRVERMDVTCLFL